jgi:hypothetical protein
MVTGVNRRLDEWTEDVLRDAAWAGAVDARQRFARQRYQFWGRFGLSRVPGTPEAIARTQTSSAHYYQRPDGGVTYDATRTSLTGDFEEVGFRKVGGRLTRFETAYLRRSAGFEINDLGYLRRADQQSWTNWLGLQFNEPTRYYRQGQWNFNWWLQWTAGGMLTERAFNTNLHAQLPNRWWIHAGGTIGALGTTLCDFYTRGGPAVRVDPYVAPWIGLEGDDRHRLIPEVSANYMTGDGGRSETVSIEPSVTIRVSPRFNTTLGLSWMRNLNDTQWYGNLTDSAGTTHYTFARLPQTETALVVRLDYTLTGTLPLQVYAQPFISKGTYANVRELADPRAADYDDRFRPYDDPAVTADPGGFNYQSFRSNVVLRWEYRPGSALFVVWTQGRETYLPAEGDGRWRDDMRNLFDLPPNNTLLVKASYWLNW